MSFPSSVSIWPNVCNSSSRSGVGGSVLSQEKFQFLKVGHDAATRLSVSTAHAPCVLRVCGVIGRSTHHTYTGLRH